MIKLNLWPEPDKDLTIKRAVFVISLTLGILAVIIQALFLVHLVTQTYLLQSEIEHVNNLISSLQTKNKESKEFEKTVNYLSRLAEEISQIKLNQLGVAKLLLELSNKIPDRVWLTTLDKKGLVLKLEGYALSDVDLANFQKSLELAELFDRVDLVKSVTVYLTKLFAYDSITKQLLMNMSETKDQSKFTNFIQNRAQNLGIKVIKGTPPSGILLNDSDLNQGTTKLSWRTNNQAIQAGIYLWSKPETLEAKNFVLETKINFRKLLVNQ